MRTQGFNGNYIIKCLCVVYSKRRKWWWWKDLRFRARGLACFRRDIIQCVTFCCSFRVLCDKFKFPSTVSYFHYLCWIHTPKKVFPCGITCVSLFQMLLHQTDKLLKSLAFQINLKLAVTLKYNNNSNDNMNNHQWTIIVIFCVSYTNTNTH